MKTRDFIIIGGVIALFYFYQKNKTKKSSILSESTSGGSDTTTLGGNMPSGGNVMPPTPKPATPKPATPRPATPRPVISVGGEMSPEIISNGNTSISNVENLISTAPQPAIIPRPIRTTEEALISDGVVPIVRDNPRITSSLE